MMEFLAVMNLVRDCHAVVQCTFGVNSVYKVRSEGGGDKTPWPLVRKRTTPTERPPLVYEIWCQHLWIEGCRVVSAADPLRSLISVF
jgi:hypothetical protein